MSDELKRWCVSQLKDMDAPLPARGQYYHLLPSQSVEQCAAGADLESVPLLSVLSGDSSTSLATYVNILPSRSSFSVGGPEPDMVGGKTYFQMKVDSSPGEIQNSFFKAVNKDSFGSSWTQICGHEKRLTVVQ